MAVQQTSIPRTLAQDLLQSPIDRLRQPDQREQALRESARQFVQDQREEELMTRTTPEDVERAIQRTTTKTPLSTIDTSQVMQTRIGQTTPVTTPSTPRTIQATPQEQVRQDAQAIDVLRSIDKGGRITSAPSEQEMRLREEQLMRRHDSLQERQAQLDQLDPASEEYQTQSRRIQEEATQYNLEVERFGQDEQELFYEQYTTSPATLTRQDRALLDEPRTGLQKITDFVGFTRPVTEEQVLRERSYQNEFVVLMRSEPERFQGLSEQELQSEYEDFSRERRIRDEALATSARRSTAADRAQEALGSTTDVLPIIPAVQFAAFSAADFFYKRGEESVERVIEMEQELLRREQERLGMTLTDQVTPTERVVRERGWEAVLPGDAFLGDVLYDIGERPKTGLALFGATAGIAGLARFTAPSVVAQITRFVPTGIKESSLITGAGRILTSPTTASAITYGSLAASTIPVFTAPEGQRIQTAAQVAVMDAAIAGGVITGLREGARFATRTIPVDYTFDAARTVRFMEGTGTPIPGQTTGVGTLRYYTYPTLARSQGRMSVLNVLDDGTTVVQTYSQPGRVISRQVQYPGETESFIIRGESVTRAPPILGREGSLIETIDFNRRLIDDFRVTGTGTVQDEARAGFEVLDQLTPGPTTTGLLTRPGTQQAITRRAEEITGTARVLGQEGVIREVGSVVQTDVVTTPQVLRGTTIVQDGRIINIQPGLEGYRPVQIIRGVAEPTPLIQTRAGPTIIDLDEGARILDTLYETRLPTQTQVTQRQQALIDFPVPKFLENLGFGRAPTGPRITIPDQTPTPTATPAPPSTIIRALREADDIIDSTPLIRRADDATTTTPVTRAPPRETYPTPAEGIPPYAFDDVIGVGQPTRDLGDVRALITTDARAGALTQPTTTAQPTTPLRVGIETFNIPPLSARPAMPSLSAQTPSFGALGRAVVSTSLLPTTLLGAFATQAPSTAFLNNLASAQLTGVRTITTGTTQAMPSTQRAVATTPQTTVAARLRGTSFTPSGLFPAPALTPARALPRPAAPFVPFIPFGGPGKLGPQDRDFTGRPTRTGMRIIDNPLEMYTVGDVEKNIQALLRSNK